jgi:ATP-dependent exoDNAse (exonuclease V) beta subunit
MACAGSGKTEVVARRVVTLLTSLTDGGGGCTPANIVAFTFTDVSAFCALITGGGCHGEAARAHST